MKTARLLTGILALTVAAIAATHPAKAQEGTTAGGTAAAAGSEEKIARGAEIYRNVGGIGCIACHGLYGEGDVGPYNRGVGEGAIRAAVDGVEDMTFLREEMTDADTEAVAAYTQWLGRTQLVKTLLKRGRFVPDRIAVRPDTSVQLVIRNTAVQPHTVTAGTLDIAREIPPRSEVALFLAAPAAEGTHMLVCADCALRDQGLTLTVSNAAPGHVLPAQPGESGADIAN